MKGGFLIHNAGMNQKAVDPTKKPHTRPLGSIRKVVSSSFDTVPKFPPLKSSMSHDLSATGSAMQVPPRQSPEKIEPESRTTTSFSQRSVASPARKSVQSSKSTDSAPPAPKPDERLQRELRESLSREKQLKHQISELQKIIEKLQAELEKKEEIIKQLELAATKMEEKYKKLYECEVSEHSTTKNQLDKTRVELDIANTTISDIKLRHDKQLKEMEQLAESNLSRLREEKDKEITIRDEKLNKLKKQMADALKGNSWERQQQLDELTKELSKIQDEADNLRFKLKSLQKNKSSAGCSNCDSVGSKLSSAQRSVSDRDNTIKDLKQMCEKYEKQINQQEQMLRKFAEQNGHNVPKRR